jgi:hypothetical protein
MRGFYTGASICFVGHIQGVSSMVLSIQRLGSQPIDKVSAPSVQKTQEALPLKKESSPNSVGTKLAWGQAF